MANIPISAFTVPANTVGIGLSGFSLTGSNAQSIVDLAGTWNTTGTPTALKLNVTDTASNAASLLMDLQVGGTSRVSVAKSGTMLFNSSAEIVHGGTGASSNLKIGYEEIALGGSCMVGWGTTPNATKDVQLRRDAAATLAQRNGTNAQTFRIYNTTDSGITNYERGFVGWTSNQFRIGTEKGGTGSARSVTIDAGASGAAPLLFRNTNPGRSGLLKLLSNASSDTNWTIENDSQTQFIWNGAEINIGDNLNTKHRLRADDGRGCWGLSVNFPLASTSFQFRSVNTAHTVLAAQGIASQTGDLQRWLDSSDNVLLSVLAGGAIQMPEQTAPAAPAANNVRIYAVDNGSGKTQLMALFATGAAQQLAIEP